MSEEFVHLHVASGYSMQYGASTPAALVQRAAAWGQPALALTDRDGLYGAVRFVRACMDHQIAPILGVDLAVVPPSPGRPVSAPGVSAPGVSARVVSAPGVSAPGTTSRRTASRGATRYGPLGGVLADDRSGVRTPVRGGQFVDPLRPRVTVLARGGLTGLVPGAGWARLCRLVTDTHLAGERGEPVTTADLLARHTAADTPEAPAPLVVLLGPDSDVGRAVLARRHGDALAALHRWRAVLPADAVVLEVVCHGGAEGTPACLGHAARTLALARQTGIPAVLTAMVRHADPGDAAIVDILDAARRLVPLDTRHLDRVTTAGYLAPSAVMAATARDIVHASGPGISGSGILAREGADRLIRETTRLALECVQDPAADLGIGSVQLPEPDILGIPPGGNPQHILARRCRESIATRYPDATATTLAAVSERLEDELAVIASLGYAAYFLTVAVVCDLIRDLGVRVAARGSGAGSIVTYLLGISGVEPLRYGLMMERFCSPLRAQLPDIDVDVESARRTEIYQKVLERFGGERVTCVSMMDSYRVRHAIRDVGAALGLPPGEIDAMAKAFPHISASRARQAIEELPELAASGLTAPRHAMLLDLVERLDGLPRHIALHPCGVVLSNSGLLDRTPVEASWLGFPMSQFDKDDVEALGLLKLDILGIRMQSAMAYAVREIDRVDGVQIDLDNRRQVPFDDEATFRLIRTTHTLGCFQIESPGQRELIGKFGPRSFEDLIVDISLFRPGPVKTDMIRPFLDARHGWAGAEYLHPSLEPVLAETEGIVVFHEQILGIVSITTGVSLAHADEARRALGSPDGQAQVEAWWRPAALARGYSPQDCDRIWAVLKGFASFGFCKAHAAAFALPTYQSAWLKTHHPAAFLAGVLTHDPGMYPKRLILDDARSLGITVLGLDVNASGDTYRVERLTTDTATAAQLLAIGGDTGPASGPVSPPIPIGRSPNGEPTVETAARAASAQADLPDARGYGIRLSLADVKGISAAEVARIVAGQPYAGLADFWRRAQVSRPVAERLALTGAFDSIYGIGGSAGLGRRGRITRRDILLHIAELERWSRSAPARSTTHKTLPGRSMGTPGLYHGGSAARQGHVAALAAAQSQAARAVIPADHQPVQLTLDLGDAPELHHGLGLPELTGPERVRAELDILGLDASAHVVEFYAPMLTALGVTRSRDLLDRRSNREVWVAGVKAATQTPPVRSGRRVVFLTLDDSTGPVDCTFFEDVQGACATTVFHSWLLLVRGLTRRTGPRGISLRATGAWELSALWESWLRGGLAGVHDTMATAEADAELRARAWASGSGAAPQRASLTGAPLTGPAAYHDRTGHPGYGLDGDPALTRDPSLPRHDDDPVRPAATTAGHPPSDRERRSDAPGGMGGGRRRRVLVHASGFTQSPYADTKPPGGNVQQSRSLADLVPEVVPEVGPEYGTAPRKLWHSSPGSSGR